MTTDKQQEIKLIVEEWIKNEIQINKLMRRNENLILKTRDKIKRGLKEDGKETVPK